MGDRSGDAERLNGEGTTKHAKNPKDGKGNGMDTGTVTHFAAAVPHPAFAIAQASLSHWERGWG